MSISLEDSQEQTVGKTAPDQSPVPKKSDQIDQPTKEIEQAKKEHGGCKGPEPTRYGDWEHNGRCTDF